MIENHQGQEKGNNDTTEDTSVASSSTLTESVPPQDAVENGDLENGDQVVVKVDTEEEEEMERKDGAVERTASNVVNLNQPEEAIIDMERSTQGGEKKDDIKQGQPSIFGDLTFTPDFHEITRNTNPTTLEWTDIHLNIKNKEILKGVSGKVSSNELYCLLGPSGAGKSSLMNVLAGRTSNGGGTKITGDVKVNGEIVNPASFRSNVSYVLQEDSLYATATTREALEFSARLRLPKGTTKEERENLVEELLKALGLKHVENTFCGSELVRGLSGGEKKRVAIGVELVTAPQILFLDEPTSGLDSWSAFQVVSILNAISRSGCAVLCTIHQPSSETFSLFDKVMVLTKGNVMYNGMVKNLPQSLDKLGFPIPDQTNPADFVLLLAQTKGDEIPSHVEQNLEKGDMIRQSSSMALAGQTSFVSKRQASTFTQLKVLGRRELLNLGRDKGALIGRFGITIFLNLLFGWIFFGAGNVNESDENYNIGGHQGAVTFAFISAMFGGASGPLLTFPLERVVFMREYSTGSYDASPYFWSKLVVEVPVTLAISLIVAIITHLCFQLQSNFASYLFAIFLLQIVCASYAFLVGAIVPTAKVAQELSPLIFVPQILFAGLFIPISLVPESIRWVQYICSLKYGVNLALIAELSGDTCRGDNGPLAERRIADCQRVVENADIDPDRAWLYVLILLLIFVVFRFSSLVLLIWRSNKFST